MTTSNEKLDLPELFICLAKITLKATPAGGSGSMGTRKMHFRCERKLREAVLCEIEIADYISSITAVVDKQTRRAEPALQVVQRNGNALSEILIKHPKFPAGWLWYSMTVSVKEDWFILSVTV